MLCDMCAKMEGCYRHKEMIEYMKDHPNTIIGSCEDYIRREKVDGKENFKKMLQDMVGESMAQDMEESGKLLARATRGYYTALIDEGFTKAQAIHFTDLFLAGIIGRIG